jgi:glycosyltransferase involved in cell wall biosynthesis
MNNRRQTLVILTPGFPRSEDDTTCLPMQQQLVKAIKRNDPLLDIIILSFHYPFFKKTYQWHDVKVISFGGKNKGGLTKLLLRQRANAALKKINSENDIIGILSFWYGECAWVAKRFADKHNLKHYCWVLGQDAKKENKYPLRLHARADELMALSDFIQDEFERNHGVRPAHMIPPGVDTSASVNMISKDIDIIAAGSLIPLKQYEILVEIVSGIKKERPGVKAVLIGDGPERAKLQKLIGEKGLDQNIRLTGELAHPEVLELMQRGKIFIHPSSYEAFGVVCIEALHAGCHVISFCRPMKHHIEGWHIVSSKEAMEQKAIEILQENHTIHNSSSPFLITDTAKAVADLFI